MKRYNCLRGQLVLSSLAMIAPTLLPFNLEMGESLAVYNPKEC